MAGVAKVAVKSVAIANVCVKVRRSFRPSRPVGPSVPGLLSPELVLAPPDFLCNLWGMRVG